MTKNILILKAFYVLFLSHFALTLTSHNIDGLIPIANTSQNQTFEIPSTVNNNSGFADLISRNENWLPALTFDVNDFDSNCSIEDISGIGETSGLTYSGSTNTLFAVSDNLDIHELDLNGNLIRSISLSGFDDTEGIVWLGGNQFGVTEERFREVVVVNINSSTTNIDYPGPSGVIALTDAGAGDNLGFEGVTYDAASDILYIGKEGDEDDDDTGIEPRIYQINNPLSEVGNVISNPIEPFTNYPSCSNFDISGLAISPTGSLLVISEQCKILFELDPSNGDILSQRSVPEFSNPEGLTMINDNEIWIIGEDNELKQYVIVGSTCDDGDPNTSNDVYTSNCQCEGTNNDALTLNVNNFNSNCLIADISGADETSGLTYSGSTNTFFTVSDDLDIYELDLDGNLIRTISLSDFNDTEGIVWLGGNQFGVTEERFREIVIVTINSGTTNINYPGSSGVIALTDVGAGDNFGFEGLAYDIANDILYVGKEGDQDDDNTGIEPRIYQINNPLSEVGNVISNPIEPFTNYPSCSNFDISGLAMSPTGSLLLISEQCKILYELNPNNGNILSQRSVPEFSNPEGVTMINDNEIWIVGENNELKQYVIIGSTCDDGDPITNSDIYTSNCDCEGSITDCPTAGQACDDGDPCTINDIFGIDPSCPCAGTYSGDSDNDGFCNALDVCPGFNDNLIGTSCDDSNICTIDDVYTSDCECVGTPLPIGDCDELCDETDFNDVESEWGIWLDGGADAARPNNGSFANSGTYSFLIKDNTATSVITTIDLDLTGTVELIVDFNFIATGFNNDTQDFWLQVSDDGGTSFTTQRTWTFNEDFVNLERSFEQVVLAGPFNANTQLRFRCDANANNDKIYIDDILIQSCSESTATCDDGIQNGQESEVDCGGADCQPCSGCFIQNANDFEDGLGIWVDGGIDARRNSLDQAFADSGIYCIRLQDDSDQSTFTTGDLEMSNYEAIEISFSYITSSMESGEGFLVQYSTDGGTTFTDFGSWELNTDFTNGVRAFAIAEVSAAFTTNTQLRLMGNGNNNSDRVYIDDVVIQGCYSENNNVIAETISEVKISKDQKTIETDHRSDNTEVSVNIFPNPSTLSNDLFIESSQLKMINNIELIGMDGRSHDLTSQYISDTRVKLNTNNLQSGSYIVRLTTDNEIITKKLLILE